MKNLPIIYLLHHYLWRLIFQLEKDSGGYTNLALIRVQGNLAKIHVSIVHFLVFSFINGNSKSEVFGEIASNFWVEVDKEETQILKNLSLLFIIQVEGQLLLRFWKSFPAKHWFSIFSDPSKLFWDSKSFLKSGLQKKSIEAGSFDNRIRLLMRVLSAL